MCSCNGQYICYEVQLTVVLQLQLDCIYLQCVADIKLVNINPIYFPIRVRLPFEIGTEWKVVFWEIIFAVCRADIKTGQDQPYLLDGELIRNAAEVHCNKRLYFWQWKHLQCAVDIKLVKINPIYLMENL